ncbi:MAG: apolipoprotein N-acyltransferase [Bdellovibrionales bacterium]|nr:apolipoprotein N-acyltransferase [Bdellovibrionales bacterium]
MTEYIYSLLFAASMGLAWQLPGTKVASLLGFIAAFSLVVSIRQARKPYFAAYLAGFAVQTPGFYWLIGTISNFGGFTLIPSLVLFLLFVAISATQFLIIVFLWKNLPKWTDTLSIQTAIAVALSEIFSIRIFPWAFAHTQLGFHQFSQIADIAGTQLVSFLLVATCELIAKILIFRKVKPAYFFVLIFFGLAVFYGQNRIEHFSNLKNETVKVALVQANISIEEKHNIKLFKRNTEEYIKLTNKISGNNLFVVWPESVITDWIFEGTEHTNQDRRLSYLNNNRAMLVGALTYRDQETFFNSAVAVNSDGSIQRPYHKQILMPFGEYTPLGKTFPFLKELNATAGDFSEGKDVKVFTYPKFKDLDVAPLICYEDIAPSLSRKAARAGAKLLVNITNDAWFGNTHAPYQHHLIASFRSIENRRALVRSTNSGLTAIVDPLGRTLSQIKPFSSGVLIQEVPLLKELSIYTKFLGDLPFKLLILLPACTFLIRRFK